MAKVCYYKPNRTKKRVFTGKDVARIAKYANEDGTDARDIAVRVIAALGMGYMLCSAAKAVNAALTMSAIIVKVGGVLAVGKILDFLLSVVTKGYFRKIPKVNRYVALIVLVLAVSEGILKATKELFDSASAISGVAELINDLCERLKRLTVD